MTKREFKIIVFRSNRFIYAQILDIRSGKTIVSIDEKEAKISSGKKMTKIEKAKLLGQLLAEKAKKLKVEKVSFDRNGYKYHGRVKALADGLREGGLKF
jgi:large subunit ribosomal protein L18